MADAARDDAKEIRTALERADSTSLSNLSRNLNSLITNAVYYAEKTPEVVRAEGELRREGEAFLRHIGPIGYYDRSDEGEAQRKRAIAAAERFEEALDKAPTSKIASILGL